MLNDELRKQLGKNIRQIRERKNLTLEQLANIISSSSGTLSNIERGKRNASLDMLINIAEALNVSISDFFSGDSQAENEYLSQFGLIKNSNDVKAKIATDNIYRNEDFKTDQFDFVKVPVLGRIPAGIPVEAKENIIDYVYVPEPEVRYGEFFYLEVQGDSMINSGIKNGYRVLVRKQPDVENGEIAVVRVNSHDATLKRVKKIDGQIILFPDNPNYEPIFIKEEGAEIVGKVVKVEFDPNKRY